jgi:hypothetical protein
VCLSEAISLVLSGPFANSSTAIGALQWFDRTRSRFVGTPKDKLGSVTVPGVKWGAPEERGGNPFLP